MGIRLIFAVAVTLLYAFAGFAGSAAQAQVRVLASAETHAMLDACDCPDAPGGGLPARATVVRGLRAEGPVLLVDAGGFGGGGMYDSYTQGRARDSVRTLAALRAMGLMGYDAVAVGDDDLQYGARWLAEAAKQSSVPLVCANCTDSSGAALFEPFVVIERGGIRFAITAAVTQERLFAYGTDIVLTDPQTALDEQLVRMKAVSDVRVVLAHLGEDISAELATRLDSVDLVVNGHRKRSVHAGGPVAHALLLNFSFQGKALSSTVIGRSNGGLRYEDAGWIEIGLDISPDSAVAAAISLTDAGPARSVYDLYIMSQCPYGVDALAQMLHFADFVPTVEWDLWFIGTVDNNGNLESLHGPEEADDEQLWLGVRALYPDRWLDFLSARVSDTVPTSELIAQSGMDSGAVRAWAGANGHSELSMHYHRSMRLAVNASPTVFLTNAPYEIALSAERLTWQECRRNPRAATVCDSQPACIDNSDCRKPGKMGVCRGTAETRRCVFRRDASFTFTVVSADSVPDEAEQAAIRTTKELFGNATIVRLTPDSKKGRSVVKRFDVDALPFYVFGSGVIKAAHFERIRQGLTPLKNGYTFLPGVMARNFLLRRESRPGENVLFIDPLIPALSEVVNAAVSADSTVRFLPIMFAPESDELPAEDIERAAEVRRWLALDALGPQVLKAYLLSLAHAATADRGGEPVAEVSIGPRVLESHWALIRELDIRSPVVLLRDNRRMIVVNGTDYLIDAFKSGRGWAPLRTQLGR